MIVCEINSYEIDHHISDELDFFIYLAEKITMGQMPINISNLSQIKEKLTLRE